MTIESAAERTERAKSTAKHTFPGLAEKCRAAFDKHIDTIREVARECGYAIGVHGSIARDIDLIAVPWVENAVSAPELAKRIRVAVGAFYIPMENTKYFHLGSPDFKPHGRLTFPLHLGGGPYIDLSVMPPMNPPYPDEPFIMTDEHHDPEAD